MATCKGFLECLLKLLNFLFTLAGLAVVGYGIYLFVEYMQMSDGTDGYSYGRDEDADFTELGRPLFVVVSLDGVYENLPRAWFIYGLIGVGVVLLVISCFGCIGIATKNGFCLTCYMLLVIALIIVQLGFAAFLYFNKSWKDEIPNDKTGNFDTVYSFLKEHWDIVRWAGLGVVVVEAMVFLLSLAVRAANRPPEDDIDNEYIAPRQEIRQRMLNKPPATGIPVRTTTVDGRPARDDAWSTRMREKYGLDTAEYMRNHSEANRIQPAPTQPSEERSCCTIM